MVKIYSILNITPLSIKTDLTLNYPKSNKPNFVSGSCDHNIVRKFNCCHATLLGGIQTTQNKIEKTVEIFKVLEKLTINGCRKIKNLKLLEKCTSLEVLKVHSSINTGVFSEALSFRIEIVN